MSSGQVFVLCIIVIVFGMGIFKQRMRLKEKSISARQPHEEREYQSRINALEERVKTLERIVTDKGYDLKREFDKL